ncbi:type II toxin-antitoxin system PemK/MazF family toxin [Kineococcus arenarius]|uniref:type II toxin-antitoxin system PemK/MazF family toxin n=1 Tax=unclassified Kineococcus TaxID=2621656 RepID=UPI003D7CBD81
MNQAFRGEVWDVAFDEAGDHPAVVISNHVLHERLGHLAVLLTTGTAGPRATHVPLDADAGLTGHDVSFVNVTDVHSVRKRQLLRLRGRLSPQEVRTVESRLGLYLSLG